MARFQASLLDQLISERPAGLGIAELQQLAEKRTGETVSRPTLLRRLRELISEGRVVAVGQGPARVYKPAPAAGPPQGASPEEDNVPMSPEGAEVRRLVTAPVTARKPVAYRREFLENYRPNDPETAYLPAAICKHLHQVGRTNMGEQPAGTYARDILNRLLVDLAWASSRLEGNTYTRLDTQRLIEFGETAEGKDAAEAQMILNHKKAIELLVDQAEEIGFNRYTLLNLHAVLSDNLMADPMASGRLRWRPVGIGGTVYHPLEVPQEIEFYFDMILEKAQAIEDPFEQAFLAMVHLPYLQPFEDVNKRVSRLAANIPLIRANLCPLSFVDVPNRAYVDGVLGVYELNRIELLRDVFVWAYERSCQLYPVLKESMAKPDPFRLKYRNALTEIVQIVVTQHILPIPAVIQELARSLVPPDDQEAFAALAENELLGLHEGNIARYALRLGQFRSWKQLQK